MLGRNPLFLWYVAFVSHFEAGVLRWRSRMLGAGWISGEVQTFDAAVAALQQPRFRDPFDQKGRSRGRSAPAEPRAERQMLRTPSATTSSTSIVSTV